MLSQAGTQSGIDINNFNDPDSRSLLKTGRDRFRRKDSVFPIMIQHPIGGEGKGESKIQNSIRTPVPRRRKAKAFRRRVGWVFWANRAPIWATNTLGMPASTAPRGYTNPQEYGGRDE